MPSVSPGNGLDPDPDPAAGAAIKDPGKDVPRALSPDKQQPHFA